MQADEVVPEKWVLLKKLGSPHNDGVFGGKERRTETIWGPCGMDDKTRQEECF